MAAKDHARDRVLDRKHQHALCGARERALAVAIKRPARPLRDRTVSSAAAAITNGDDGPGPDRVLAAETWFRPAAAAIVELRRPRMAQQIAREGDRVLGLRPIIEGVIERSHTSADHSANSTTNVPSRGACALIVRLPNNYMHCTRHHINKNSQSNSIPRQL